MSFFRNIIKLSLVFCLLLFVFGCSGGSSSQNLAPVNTAGASGSAGVSVAKTSLVQSENTLITATFTKADGTSASGVSVTFSTTLGSISPVTSTTDSQGIATSTLMSGTTAGQGQVTANATYDGKTYVKTGNFQVSLPPLTLSPITLGLSTLSYGGSTSISVTVKGSNGAPYTDLEVDVVFTSTQATLGKATINSPVRTVNGVATTTYLASTVTGTDTITASITGSSVNAALTVNPLAASSIAFVSALPANIGLKGMGGAGIQETSVVTFKVLDTAGLPKSNQQVDFTLNTTLGGLSLVSASGSTSNDGTVSTTVQSGTIATPVRVTATLRGSSPLITTQSDQLVVSTGVPSQDGFSISIATLNPESLNVDGVADIVTARLSDHFHNPVPDGTAVYFTTSGGSIQPSCITVGGKCSVTWTSQNPRPSNGRARILAYAVGEEAFLDINGNGVADAGEFTDGSEAYRDDNENNSRDASETFIDFNADGIFNGPDGRYNGVLQGAAYVGAPKSKHVFSNSTLVMAGSAAAVTNSCGSSIAVLLNGSKSCDITISDVNGNTMPAGTKVAFSFTSVTDLIKLTSDDYTFPNSSANSGVILNVILTDDGTAPVGRGVLKVTVTTPGGVVTTKNYSVN